MSREIRCYEYVNHAYDAVRTALTSDALSVFQNATSAAAQRAENVAARLRVNIAGIEVGTDIAIDVTGIEERAAEVTAPATTRIVLEWQASQKPRLFPIMKAELSVYSLTATETQIDFLGHYEAPLGVVGSAMNAMVGHRIAEASVHRFVRDVAEYLRATLA